MNRLKSKSFRAVFAVFMAMLFAILSGCGLTDKEKAPRFSSTAMPNVSAESIDYYLSGDLEYNCFIYKSGGKYGTLSENGERLSDPVFDTVYTSLTAGDDGDYAKWALMGFEGENCYLISQNGIVSPADPYGIGFEQWCCVYWTPEGPRMFIYGIDDSEETDCNFNEYYSYQFISVDAYMSFPDRSEISRVIPVREVTDIRYEMIDGVNTAVAVYKSYKYGLFDFDTNKMITGFVYDDCSAFAVGGVFAAKKGDSWGYVTDTGEEITGFNYEVAYDDYEYDLNVRKMFQPVNGYIVVKSGGKYGIIDLNGEVIAGCEYDYLSQVNVNGVFWANKGGEWSRCSIIESKAE